MEWHLVEDKEKWDQFVAGQNHAQFLQSWDWGEFQQAYGRRVFRIGGFEGGTQKVAGQIIEHYLGLGTAYFYFPRGPILKANNQEVIKEIVGFVKKNLVNYGTLFLKMEGQRAEEINLSNVARRPSVQPANTVLLDLEKMESEILSGMHQKTRYNIHLAYKKKLD